MFLLNPCCLGGQGGVTRRDASIGDMWAIPIVTTLPSCSLGFGLQWERLSTRDS